MAKLNYYEMVGCSIELLSRSDYHRQFNMNTYLQIEILPPIRKGQVKFYLDEEGMPMAMITWAWLSDEIEKDVISTGRALNEDEWFSGEKLFCNDWITPCNNLRKVVHDISTNMFPDQIGTSVRRNPDGSVRKINRWVGKNIRLAGK